MLVAAVVCSLQLALPPLAAALSPAARAHSGIILSVSPIPTSTHPHPGTPEVTWSTGGGPGLVTVATAGIHQQLFARAPEGTQAAPWISVGHVYVFRLYSTVGGSRLLARLDVGRNLAPQIISLPRGPRITSQAIDDLLLALCFAALAGSLALGALHVRDRRRGG